MVGLMYDFVENPQGAVRLTFEKAAAAAAELGGDPAAAFSGKDWGVADLFRDFLFEKGGIVKVPIIDQSNRGLIRPNTLVRFRGMVQDLLGNELYIGAFKDAASWRTNKYSDVASFPIPEALNTAFWQRQLLNVVPVPGHNSWALESSSPEDFANLSFEISLQKGEKRNRDVEFDDNLGESVPSESKKQKINVDPNQVNCSPSELTDQGCSSETKNECSFSCLVKVYDMPESAVKLNEVYEFICIYTFDPELVNPKDDTDDMLCEFVDSMLDHLPSREVPRLHCIMCRKLSVQDFLPSSQFNEGFPLRVKEIRDTLLRYLTQLLGNDGLAAHSVLLHLLSRLRARVDVVSVGRLSLNLTGFTRESAPIYGNQLFSAVQSLLPFSQVIPLTREYLNTAKLQPRRDNKTGRLITGVLQLAEGTHVTFDETYLHSGMLDANGVQNVSLLKHLMESQAVEYDFEYYKLEMSADVQLLILSDGKSNILPADLVLPFRPTDVNPVMDVAAEDLQAWRWYLATLRSLPHNSEPEMHQLLQDEMVAAMKEDRNLGCADLSRLLTMARLVCTSFGETKLSLEHWQMVMEMERLRKERLIN